MKDCTSLVLNSEKCCESFADPSSPVISSYENLLRTPTPPEVTTIPEDILQVSFPGYFFFWTFLSKSGLYIKDLKLYKNGLISHRANVLDCVLRKSKLWALSPSWEHRVGCSGWAWTHHFIILLFPRGTFSLCVLLLVPKFILIVFPNNCSPAISTLTVSTGGVAGKIRNAVYVTVLQGRVSWITSISVSWTWGILDFSLRKVDLNVTISNFFF